jgi:glutamine synthetase
MNNKNTNDMRSLILEYIWLDGKMNLRSKYKTIKIQDNDLNIDQWSYDGLYTYQYETDDSEVILNPVAFYNNPFFDKGQSLLVLCDTFYERNTKYIPTSTNRRIIAREILLKKKELDPWFEMEQEYFMMCNEYTHSSSTPLFFKNPKQPKEQGDYYCGVGNQNIVMRSLAEKHYVHCLTAGINISGINAEIAPNQWKFKIGQTIGIAAGDELILARYILMKLSEQFGVDISFKPKPLQNPWNSSSLNVFFSTTESREENGITKLNTYIENLTNKHKEHMAIYGGNLEKIPCKSDKSDATNLNICIPNKVTRERKGYLQDNRPVSDADPYIVIGKIFDTCCVSID